MKRRDVSNANVAEKSPDRSGIAHAEGEPMRLRTNGSRIGERPSAMREGRE